MQTNDRPVLRAITTGVGLITLLIGILFLFVPTFVKMGNEWILGIMLVAAGVMNGGFALTALRRDIRTYTTLLALLALITGFTILFNPLDRSITLTTLLGLYFMVESGLMAGVGTAIRSERVPSLILQFVALGSFVMSMLIWLKLAGAPKPVIVGMLGINFILRGIAFMVISMRMKGRGPLQPARPATAADLASAHQ